MNPTISITGRNVEATDPLKEYTSTKLTNRLTHRTRHLSDILSIQVIFEKDNLDLIAKATVNVPGKDLHASYTSRDMYAAVDGLIDILDRQIKTYRDKLTDHR